MKKISSTQKALLGIVVFTLVVVAFKASSGQLSSDRGGTLFATQASANNVSLESDRFYCASCVARMESDFYGVEGIQSIDIIQGEAGLGALSITFDQDKLDIVKYPFRRTPFLRESWISDTAMQKFVAAS